MEIKLYCPENLDIQALMEARPNEAKGIKQDHLLFIVHSIIMEKATHDDEHLKNLGKKDGFVPLHSKVLEQKMPVYRKPLDFLLSSAVIECDDQYIPDYVSKGYRLQHPYKGSKVNRVQVKDFVFKRKIREDKIFTPSNTARRKYPYLIKWFRTNKLQIDETATIKWINEVEAQQMDIINNSTCSSTIRQEEKTKLVERCAGYKILVTRLAEHDYFCHIDETGNRLHTNLTNLPKGLRKYLKYDSENLVSIDIKNSQPYMSMLLFNKTFWQSYNRTDIPTLKYLSKEVYGSIKGNDSNLHTIIMFVDSSKTLTCIDFQKQEFFKNVIHGTLYEYLQSVFENECHLNLGNTDAEKRNRVKKIVLTLLFDAEWKAYNRKQDSPMQVFHQKFPSIARVFAYVKKDNHRNLAIILQRIESFLLLEQVCGRISKERPDVPLFTIHDNIVTTVGNETYVQSIMEAELAKVMGASPTFSIEYWQDSPNETQQSIFFPDHPLQMFLFLARSLYLFKDTGEDDRCKAA